MTAFPRPPAPGAAAAFAGPQLRLHRPEVAPPPAPSADQLSAIAAARDGAVIIRRTARAANINAWMLAVGAGLALVTAPWSLSSLFVGLALALAAGVEFSGRQLLLRGESRGARRLAMNQALVAATIVGYCGWSIFSTFNEGGAAMLSPELQNVGDPELQNMIDGWAADAPKIIGAVYGIVAIITCAVEGVMAWYYLSRAVKINRYRAQHPDWAIRLALGQP